MQAVGDDLVSQACLLAGVPDMLLMHGKCDLHNDIVSPASRADEVAMHGPSSCDGHSNLSYYVPFQDTKCRDLQHSSLLHSCKILVIAKHLQRTYPTKYTACMTRNSSTFTPASTRLREAALLRSARFPALASLANASLSARSVST